MFLKKWFSRPKPADSKSKQSKTKERTAPRASCDIKVLSSGLVEEAAQAVDISREGIQVETLTRLYTGSLLSLEIQFDTEQLPPVLVEAVVQWSAPAQTPHYRVGFRFRDLDPKIAQTLGTYRELMQMRHELGIDKT